MRLETGLQDDFKMSQGRKGRKGNSDEWKRGRIREGGDRGERSKNEDSPKTKVCKTTVSGPNPASQSI